MCLYFILLGIYCAFPLGRSSLYCYGRVSAIISEYYLFLILSVLSSGIPIAYLRQFFLFASFDLSTFFSSSSLFCVLSSFFKYAFHCTNFLSLFFNYKSPLSSPHTSKLPFLNSLYPPFPWLLLPLLFF